MVLYWSDKYNNNCFLSLLRFVLSCKAFLSDKMFSLTGNTKSPALQKFLWTGVFECVMHLRLRASNSGLLYSLQQHVGELELWWNRFEHTRHRNKINDFINWSLD
jgi:hypothetical protein